MTKTTETQKGKAFYDDDLILNNRTMQEELLGKLWKTYHLHDERKTMSDREYYHFMLDDCPGDKYEYIIGKTYEGKYICISFVERGLALYRGELDINNLEDYDCTEINGLHELSDEEFEALNRVCAKNDYTYMIARYLRHHTNNIMNNDISDEEIIKKFGSDLYNGIVGIDRNGSFTYIFCYKDGKVKLSYTQGNKHIVEYFNSIEELPKDIYYYVAEEIRSITYGGVR